MAPTSNMTLMSPLANWSILYPEIWLLVMACVVLLVDLYTTDPARGPTFWLTQFTVAMFAAGTGQLRRFWHSWR